MSEAGKSASSYWTEAQMQSVHHMMNPRSIAVVGATERMQYGGRMLALALRAKDRVRVYPVNPKYKELLGARCYPSLSDLPEPPDVVGIVVPHNQVLDVMRESHARGARSAVIISAGFSERGDSSRARLQDELAVFARSSGVRASGPNGLGLVNAKDDIWLSSATLDARSIKGPIGMVCQSGASAFGTLLPRALDENIGCSYVVSTGNEADLDLCDFMRYLLDDESTRVLAGFAEGFKDGRKFLEVARLAAERNKPILLIKVGRSSLGTNAARSHTAALTGEDALYEAALKQYGVIRVQEYDELLQMARLFARTKKPRNRGIALLSHSGGINSLAADMCGQAGLDLPPLTDQARDGINGILKGVGWAANPVDATGFVMGDQFPKIMQYLTDQPRVGTLAVASGGGDGQAEQVAAHRESSGLNLAFLWTESRSAAAGLKKLKEAGVPVFYTPDKLAFGLRSMLDYHDWREQRIGAGFPGASAMSDDQRSVLARLQGLGRQGLSESESKMLLGAWGIPAAPEILAGSVTQAVAAAERLGFPVALKADSADIAHKTEAGAVRLHLRDAAEVSEAFEQVLANARRHFPNARLNGASVQQMVGHGVEVIVGVNYDPQLGPVLMFGTGGVTVELYRDVAFRVCPIDRIEAMRMIDEVKGAKLLRGFRGRPPADIGALADALVAVARLAMNLEGSLAELDINPLMVLPEGQGVCAVDALVILK